jgi:hypothetical protein
MVNSIEAPQERYIMSFPRPSLTVTSCLGKCLVYNGWLAGKMLCIEQLAGQINNTKTFTMDRLTTITF